LDGRQIENAQNRLPSNGANQCPPGANSQSRMADWATRWKASLPCG